MKPGKKSLLRVVIDTAKAHVRETFKDISTNAKNVAEEDYGVKMEFVKPKLDKIWDDLKKWNSNRKEENRLNREELKEVAKGMLSETKKAIVDPASVKDEDMEELNDLMASMNIDFEDDLRQMEGLESDETNRDNLPQVTLTDPAPEAINLFVLGILMSCTKDAKFMNYINSDLSNIKEMLDIREYTDADVVVESAMNAEMEHPIEDQSMVEEIITEIDNSNTNVNLDLAINAEEINNHIGVESEAYQSNEEICIYIREHLLRAYQRNDGFCASIDRVMTLINKVIMNYEGSNNEELQQGLNILSSNPTIYQIIDLFEFNIIDAVSFFAIFYLYGDQETDYLIALEEHVAKLSNSLDGISQIVE